MSHSVCHFVAIQTPGVERGVGLVVHHGFGGQVAFADGQWQFLVYKGVVKSGLGSVSFVPAKYRRLRCAQ